MDRLQLPWKMHHLIWALSIDGADYTNATGMFNNLSPGSYTLTIKSLSQGCVYTHPTPVVVPVGNPLPTPADPAIVVCPEDANPYNLTAHDNAVLDGDVGTVAWFDGDPEVAGVAIADPTDVDLAAITDLWAQVTHYRYFLYCQCRCVFNH
jgi:hypothetical protein